MCDRKCDVCYLLDTLILQYYLSAYIRSIHFFHNRETTVLANHIVQDLYCIVCQSKTSRLLNTPNLKPKCRCEMWSDVSSKAWYTGLGLAFNPVRLWDVTHCPCDLQRGGQPLGLAVDLGCGTGQLSRLLAPHFQELVGLDISEGQLEEARAGLGCPNVTYR